MKFNTIIHRASVQHSAHELNRLMAIIKETPEIDTTQTRQQLNTHLLDLYIKLMNAGDLTKQTQKYVNR